MGSNLLQPVGGLPQLNLITVCSQFVSLPAARAWYSGMNSHFWCNGFQVKILVEETCWDFHLSKNMSEIDWQHSHVPWSI